MNSVAHYNKLFIVGCPRSGTTWLQRMLVNHDDILPIKNESHLYRLVYEPFTYVSSLNSKQRLDRWQWVIKNFGLKALLFGASSQDIWNSILRSYRIYQRNDDIGLHHLVSYQTLKTLIRQVKSRPENDRIKAQRLIRLILDAFFEQCGGKNSQILLEKTPLHIKHVDVILNSFPEAKVVNIIRDGRDVCASLKSRSKTQKWAQYDIKTIITQWEKCIRLGEQFAADPALKDRIYSVKYEDLRQNTLAELKNIYAFVGISIESEALQRIVDSLDIKNVKDKGEGQHVNKGQIDNWKEALPEEDIQLWHGSAGEALVRLGYSIA